MAPNFLPSTLCSSIIMDDHSTGHQFEFRSIEPPKGKIVVPTFTLEVTKTLAVGFPRRSQVVVAKFIDPNNSELSETRFVVKFFDQTLYTIDEEEGWPRNRKKSYDTFQKSEAKAYNILHPLQGNGIPHMMILGGVDTGIQ